MAPPKKYDPKGKFSCLDSQWGKEELQRFYVAYRKFGKEWKKVAAIVRTRSVEKVEALYNLNRAYLSLPEGTASVVGLIAMMTDYYNNMQRRMLEECLYPLVDQLQHDSADKVARMLLKMDPTEVIHLLESPEALKAKVEEVMNVLQNMAQHNCHTDQLASLSLNDNLV